MIAGLLTSDFRLGRLAADSTGSVYRTGYDRDATLLSFRTMFEGLPGEGGPAIISLRLGDDVVVSPIPLPGRSAIHHRFAHVDVNAEIQDVGSGKTYTLVGALAFTLTRGDRAAVPADTPGVPADSTTWWVDGVEDLAIIAVDGLSGPTTRISLSSLVGLYLGRATGRTEIADLFGSRRR